MWNAGSDGDAPQIGEEGARVSPWGRISESPLEPRLVAIHDSALGEIVGGEFHGDSITGDDSNEETTHST